MHGIAVTYSGVLWGALPTPLLRRVTLFDPKGVDDLELFLQGFVYLWHRTQAPPQARQHEKRAHATRTGGEEGSNLIILLTFFWQVSELFHKFQENF